MTARGRSATQRLLRIDASYLNCCVVTMRHTNRGLHKFLAKELSIGIEMINARGETVATKRGFRDSFRGALLAAGRRVLRVGEARQRREKADASLGAGAPL